MQLADTNIISELMRRQPNAGVQGWRDMTDAMQGRIAISVITVDEIFYGLQRKPNAAMLAWFDGFIGRNLVLDATALIARRAGEMRGSFAAKGQVRSQADMLIAATAQVHAMSLVTRNVRDFDGCGIAVLNPFTP